MFDKKLLITGKLPVLKTKLLDNTRRDYFQNPQKDCAEIQYDIFIKKIELVAVHFLKKNTVFFF